MKTRIGSRSILGALAALTLVAAAACSDAPKDDSISAKAVTHDDVATHVDAAPVVVPDYTPTGDDADLKKQGAAGITASNASLKAAELEGAIDAATKAVAAPKKT